MDFRWLLLSFMLVSEFASTAESGQFCIVNRLHKVAAAVSSNVSIGISLEKNGRVVYPKDKEPKHIRWTSKRCFPAKREETLVILEKTFLGWSGWKEVRRFKVAGLDSVDVELGKAGRVDKVYGINLVYRLRVDNPLPPSQSWMASLYSGRDIPLNSICMPGSHNTGSYGMSAFSKKDPEMDPQLRNLFDKVKFDILGVPIKQFMVFWGKDQGEDTYHQLKRGVRYLDIRARVVKGQLVTAHGLVGASMEEVIADLEKFLAENPGEVVIFHVSETNGMSSDSVQTLYQTLTNRFGGKMAPANLSSSVTFAKLQEMGHQLIVVARDTYQNPLIWSWTRNLRNTWHDENRPDDLLEDLESDIRSRNSRIFHVSQMILTPNDEDMKLMAAPGNPKSLERLAKTLRYPSGFLRYLNNIAATQGKGINIILQDYLENSDVYQACMAENIRGLPES